MASDAQNNPFVRHLTSSGMARLCLKSTEQDADFCDRQEGPRPSARITTNVPGSAIRDFRTRPAEIMERTILLYALFTLHQTYLLLLPRLKPSTNTVFTGLWMQDKPALQQALSRDLASLVSHLRTPVVLPFLRAFFVTMAREWSHIEALRLDKYLYLIRRYLNASFEFLACRKWKASVLEDWNKIVEETPLDPSDMKIPNGLRYHMLDIWADELEKVAGEKWEKEAKEGRENETLELLVKPIETMKQKSTLKVLRDAAQECLDDERLRLWRGLVEEDEVSDEMDMDDGEVEWGGFDD
jgi:ribosomal RNA-processing protein 1